MTTKGQTPRPKTPLGSVRPGRSKNGTGVSSRLSSWTWSIDDGLCIGLRLMMPSPVQFKFSSSSDGNQSQRDQRVDQHQPRKISCGEQGRDDRWGRLRGWANTRLPPGAGVLEPDGMPQAVLLPTEGLGDTLESSIPLPGPRLGPLGSLDANTSPPTPLRNLPQPTDTTRQAARRKPIRAPRYTSPQMSTFPGRPAVAEKVSASRRRPVSQRSLGIPSGRAQPTKPLRLS